MDTQDEKAPEYDPHPKPKPFGPGHLRRAYGKGHLSKGGALDLRREGTQVKASVLNPDLVVEIRSSQKSNRYWADKLGCCDATISTARRGLSWQHVKTPPKTEHLRRKLDEEVVREIRKSEESCRWWGRKLGVSHSCINDIRRGKTWKHVK